MENRVVELIRVSTEGQASEEHAGLAAQRAANRRTAAAHRLRIVRTIEMIDVSGAAVLSSPKMADLLELIRLPEIHGVVAKEFSRLMRPEKLSDFTLLQEFVDSKTILYLPEGPIDLASKNGRLVGAIRALMSGAERSEILERMRDAKEAMRRGGKHVGGPQQLPYGVGYSKQKGEQLIDMATRRLARDAAGMRVGSALIDMPKIVVALLREKDAGRLGGTPFIRLRQFNADLNYNITFPM